MTKHIIAFAGVLLACCSAIAAEEARRPNVLLIMTDDQGWGDLGVHGNTQIDTPTLDALAAASVQFDRFYVSPVCAPTRASLLTGRYHMRTGVTGVTRGQETMRAEEVTIAEVLKKAGYSTGCFGKWHSGAHYPHHPNGQGFDEFFGFCGGHWNNYFDSPLERNGRAVQTSGYITDVITQAAIGFIEQHRSEPFFCYVPYNAPHGPFQVPDKYFDKYIARGLDAKTATVYGMCENIDQNVARLIETLEANGLTRDTIVIFLTDNGPNGARFNGGMRGAKGSAHEGGCRVPLFIHWPDALPAGHTVKEIAAHIDLLPTICSLCGVKPTGTKPLDGISLVPLLKGDSSSHNPRMLFTHWGRNGQVVPINKGAVRTQRYRLVREKAAYELYDMEADPGQKKNIAAELPDVTNDLKVAYEQWHRDVVGSGGLNTKSGVLRLPIPVGHPQARRIDLPATEAFFDTSQLHYANNSGFAHDWLTDWDEASDRASWEIDVARNGRFEVSVVGTFPAAAIGATFKVSVGDQTVAARLERPWAPEPGIRPDRTDSYKNRRIQAFVPLRLGEIDLRQGRQKLTLTADNGDRPLGIDVHSVRLEYSAPDRNYPPQLAGARVEVFKTIGEIDLRTWIFEPQSHKPADSRPAAVFFFGGGWRSGTPAQFHRHCEYLAARGMVAMTAEYRVRKRHGTLAVDCIADAKSAVRWMRQNAGRLGINPDRIVAGGGSAGGHLAACTGTLREFDEPNEDLTLSSVPNAMALFNPALMLAPHNGRNPFDHERMYGMPERVGADPMRASPVHHVRRGVPPTIIFHGKADNTVAFFTAEMFTDAMQKAGNRCELSGFDGENHGFFNFGRGDGTAYTQTIQQLDQFLVSLGYLSELKTD